MKNKHWKKHRNLIKQWRLTPEPCCVDGCTKIGDGWYDVKMEIRPHFSRKGWKAWLRFANGRNSYGDTKLQYMRSHGWS